MINEWKRYKNVTDQREVEKYRKFKNLINRERKKSKETLFNNIYININAVLKFEFRDT